MNPVVALSKTINKEVVLLNVRFSNSYGLGKEGLTTR